MLFGALVAMAWLDWRLMLIVLLLVPAAIVIVWLYQRLAARGHALARAAQRDQRADGREHLRHERAAGHRRRAALRARFDNTNRAHYRARLGELRANAWLLRPALDLLNVC